MKTFSALGKFYSRHVVIITGVLALIGFMLWIAHFLREDFIVPGNSLAIEWKNYQPKVEFGPDGTNPKFFFNQFPKFELWILFNATQVGIWFALTPLALFIIIKVIREYDLNVKMLLVNYAIIIVTVVAVLLIIKYTNYNYFLNFGFDTDVERFNQLHDKLFANQASKINVGNVIGFFAQTFIVACLVSLVNAARSLEKSYNDHNTLEQSKDAALQKFIKLRETFFSFIVFVTLEIVFTFIATSILSSAINNLATFTIYPFEHVLALGFLMTIILSAFFLPAYFKLNAIGHGLIDKYLNSLNLTNYEDRVKKTKELSDHLHISFTLRQNLQIFLAAISPLLGTILPALIERII